MSHRFLILGLLAERPMSGYDMKKRVSASLSTVTSASYGTLYPTLHKLLSEGQVKVQEIQQEGRPIKKVYQITEKGRLSLKDWLLKPPANDQVRREFLLKLYLGKDLKQEDVLKLLANRRDETRAKLKLLKAERKRCKDKQQTWVMEYALALCKAEMDWLNQVEAQVAVV